MNVWENALPTEEKQARNEAFGEVIPRQDCTEPVCPLDWVLSLASFLFEPRYRVLNLKWCKKFESEGFCTLERVIEFFFSGN